MPEPRQARNPGTFPPSPSSENPRVASSPPSPVNRLNPDSGRPGDASLASGHPTKEADRLCVPAQRQPASAAPITQLPQRQTVRRQRTQPGVDFGLRSPPRPKTCPREKQGAVTVSHSSRLTALMRDTSARRNERGTGGLGGPKMWLCQPDWQEPTRV